MVKQSLYGKNLFIIPKIEGTVRFIKDHLRHKYKLVRRSYPLPIIGKTMQQMQVFQYVTALDLNMGYYTIRLFTTSQYMTTMVTECEKFRYNRRPIGM